MRAVFDPSPRYQNPKRMEQPSPAQGSPRFFVSQSSGGGSDKKRNKREDSHGSFQAHTAASAPPTAAQKHRWTKEEDIKLREGIDKLGEQNWKAIAQEYLGNNRTDIQCLHRWKKVLKPGLVKGPWSTEEDSIIISLKGQGGLKWSEIATRIPGRMGKQCRERWCNHLDPSLKKGDWSAAEDAVITEARDRWGNTWSKIATLLPGRAENGVKNRWNSATRRRSEAAFGIGALDPEVSRAGGWSQSVSPWHGREPVSEEATDFGALGPLGALDPLDSPTRRA